MRKIVWPLEWQLDEIGLILQMVLNSPIQIQPSMEETCIFR